MAKRGRPSNAELALRAARAQQAEQTQEDTDASKIASILSEPKKSKPKDFAPQPLRLGKQQTTVEPAPIPDKEAPEPLKRVDIPSPDKFRPGGVVEAVKRTTVSIQEFMSHIRS